MYKNLLLILFAVGSLFMQTEGQNLIDKVQENFENVSVLYIKGSFCQVTIKSSPGSATSLDGEIRAVRKWDNLRIRHSQNNGKLSIWIEQPENLTGQTKGYLNVTVPPSTQLFVETISGNISVHSSGKSITELKSISGSIIANDIHSDLNVNTVSGNIRAEYIYGETRAKAVSGKVSLNEIQGPANVSTVSGSAEAISVNGGVKVKTTSGSIRLKDIIEHAETKSVSGSIAIESVQGHVQAGSTSGSISLNKITGGMKLKTISGTISGTGIIPTTNCYFNSNSGDIKIELEADLNTLSFNLSSSSGKLTVGNLQASKQLRTEAGGIEIVAKTTSGSQSFK